MYFLLGGGSQCGTLFFFNDFDVFFFKPGSIGWNWDVLGKQIPSLPGPVEWRRDKSHPSLFSLNFVWFGTRTTQRSWNYGLIHVSWRSLCRPFFWKFRNDVRVTFWKVEYIIGWNYPHPVTVTTRIITFLVGNPYKPSFATVTGWGVDPKYITGL